MRRSDRWKAGFRSVLLAGAVALCGLADRAPAEESPPDLSGWSAEAVGVDALMSWPKWGRGERAVYGAAALQMVEDEDSAGLMVISPEPEGTRVALTYRVMTLRPATVLVAMLSLAEDSDTGELRLPGDFDGAMSAFASRSHYFFAFHNAPHLRYPFVLRGRPGGGVLLQEADRTHMQPGRWYEIEVGRADDRVWLRIDGHPVLDVRDPDSPGGGHVALRIRGTGLERASCMIRDLHIHRPEAGNPLPAEGSQRVGGP